MDRRVGSPGTDVDRADELRDGLLRNADPDLIGSALSTADLAGRVDLMTMVQGLASNAGAAALVRSTTVQRQADGDGANTGSSLSVGQDAPLDQGQGQLSGDDAAQLASLPSLVDPVAVIFDRVVASNVSGASAIAVPARYVTLLNAYAAFNAADGAILTAGLGRSPTYYSGGWILDIQRAAKAMTLDTSVFVRGELDLATYIHEMVHVNQYSAGTTNFLVGYFGLSAAEIAKRLIMHLPIDPMTASPQEQQAYAIEGRFMTWWRAHPEADPASPPSTP